MTPSISFKAPGDHFSLFVNTPARHEHIFRAIQTRKSHRNQGLGRYIGTQAHGRKQIQPFNIIGRAFFITTQAHPPTAIPRQQMRFGKPVKRNTKQVRRQGMQWTYGFCRPSPTGHKFHRKTGSIRFPGQSAQSAPTLLPDIMPLWGLFGLMITMPLVRGRHFPPHILDIGGTSWPVHHTGNVRPFRPPT